MGLTGAGAFASGTRTSLSSSIEWSSASSSSSNEKAGVTDEGDCGDNNAEWDNGGALECEWVLRCVKGVGEGVGEASAAKSDWDTSERRSDARFWLLVNLEVSASLA